MAEAASDFEGFILQGREERDLEYKGTRGREPFAWGPDPVNAKIARTVMGMANIGGGTIVIGMDQVGPDQWEPNGISPEVSTSYAQDQVQRYVNGRADPYVALAVRHTAFDGKVFIVIQIAGFDELPVVCTVSTASTLRQGAIYTRSRSMNETVEIQSQTEMRELLDRAIEVGVERRLVPILRALQGVGGLPSSVDITGQRFDQQRGIL